MSGRLWSGRNLLLLASFLSVPSFLNAAGNPSCVELVASLTRYYPMGHINYIQIVSADARSMAHRISSDFSEINQDTLRAILELALENGASHSPIIQRSGIGETS